MYASLFLRYLRLNIRKHFQRKSCHSLSQQLKCNAIDFSSFKRFKMSLLSCDLSKYVHF